jgi:hypothetical protein
MCAFKCPAKYLANKLPLFPAADSPICLGDPTRFDTFDMLVSNTVSSGIN